MTKKLVYGVGVNDADYKTRKYESIGGKSVVIWTCPFYRRWKSLLERCYSEKFLKTHPTYSSCVTCSDWLVFSNFKRWMELQDWEGKHLDKDILQYGNKVYSPATCVFIHPKVNGFVLDCGRSRGSLPLGVSLDRGKFKSSCSNTFTNKQETLGHFNCPNEAHLEWKRRKHELACQLADSEYVGDDRVAQALRTRYL